MEPMSFKIDSFISTIKRLASNPQLLEESAIVAETAKDDYGVSSLVNKWENLFQELSKERR